MVGDAAGRGRSVVTPEEPEDAVPQNCGIVHLLDDVRRMSLLFAGHGPSPVLLMVGPLSL